MAMATLTAFDDVGDGRVDLEIAPAGMLLVIAFGDPYRVGIGDKPLDTAEAGFAIGAQTCHGRSALKGSAEGVQVDLPWSAALTIFGPDMPELADQAVGFADLTGGADLLDRLPGTPPTERTRLVGRWLRARADAHAGANPLAVRALQRIEEGTPSVGALASELGCSRAHLHRVVRRSVGQPPSTLLRVVRLHSLVAAARSTPTDRSIADAATRWGYSDHPHLCHETQRLAGQTPTQLLGRKVEGSRC